MNGSYSTRTIDVSREEAVEFVQAVKKCAERTDGNLWETRLGFAISFDADFLPFLGRRRGFNHPADRAYFPFDVAVLNKIGKILSDHFRDRGAKGIAGGKVFISREGVKRIGESGDVDVICTWEWPLPEASINDGGEIAPESEATSDESRKPGQEEIEAAILETLESLPGHHCAKSLLPAYVARFLGVESKGHLPIPVDLDIDNAFGDLLAAGCIEYSAGTDHCCLPKDFKGRLVNRVATIRGNRFRLERPLRQGELPIIGVACAKDVAAPVPPVQKEEVPLTDVEPVLPPESETMPEGGPSDSRLDLSLFVDDNDEATGRMTDGDDERLPPLPARVDAVTPRQKNRVANRVELEENNSPVATTPASHDVVQTIMDTIEREPDFAVRRKMGSLHVQYSGSLLVIEGEISHALPLSVGEWRIQIALPYVLSATTPLLELLSQDSFVSALRLGKGPGGTMFVLRHIVRGMDPAHICSQIFRVFREAELAMGVIARIE